MQKIITESSTQRYPTQSDAKTYEARKTPTRKARRKGGVIRTRKVIVTVP
jgi:hypothetical protein